VLPAVPEVDRAVSPALLIERHLGDPGPSDDARAVGHRVRHMRDVGRRLGSFRATHPAHAVADTLALRAVVLGGYRVSARPPVPAQAIHPLSHGVTRSVQGRRRERRSRPRGISRVAGQPRDAHPPSVSTWVDTEGSRGGWIMPCCIARGVDGKWHTRGCESC